MNVSNLMEVAVVGGLQPNTIEAAATRLTAAGLMRAGVSHLRGGAAPDLPLEEVLLVLLCSIAANPGTPPEHIASALSELICDDPRAVRLLGTNDLWAATLTQLADGAPDIHELSLDRGATGAAIVTTGGARLDFHNLRHPRPPMAASYSTRIPGRLLRLFGEAATLWPEGTPYGERIRLWAEWRLERLAPLGVHPLMGAA